MVSVRRDRPQQYRRRAEELRVEAESMPDAKARASLLRDAEMWERMAAWEEQQPSSLDEDLISSGGW